MARRAAISRRIHLVSSLVSHQHLWHRLGAEQSRRDSTCFKETLKRQSKSISLGVVRAYASIVPHVRLLVRQVYRCSTELGLMV
jgi:hypothetical protein